MKALVATGTGSATVTDVPDLPLRDTFVKIRVHAVALNPTDYKHVFHHTRGGEIVGCDVAGVVTEIGARVQTSVKIGDRVAGLVHGCNSLSPRDGGFAEYAELKDGIFARIPESWSWGSAATLGAGITTAGQGLFQSLGLPLPAVGGSDGVSGSTLGSSEIGAESRAETTVLIYGGGTATGCLAVQFAALAGFRTLVLASERHFARLKGLGACECFDYRDASVGTKIRDETRGELMLAFDIITDGGSMRICADALAKEGKDGARPRCTLLLPGKIFPRDDVDVRFTSGYSAIGETSIKYGKVVEGEPEHYEFAKMLWTLTDWLIEQGQLKPHDVEERPGGLDGILSGLEDLRDGKVKGHKLVFTL